MYYTYYSVLRKGAQTTERSTNMACYAQWVHTLSALDKVIVHLALTQPLTGNSILEYSKKEVFRYLRALQRAGFKFTFSADNLMPKMTKDYYGKDLPLDKQERDTKCYNIEIDLTKYSQINAQIVMFCVRFLHEMPKIADAFLRFLEDDRLAKKKSGVQIFDKMLIAMLAHPGSGHSFGVYSAYNVLLEKEGFKRVIVDSKVINQITSKQLPKTRGCTQSVYTDLCNKVRATNTPFAEILKVYKEECVKYM